jgi:hypothetical protein
MSASHDVAIQILERELSRDASSAGPAKPVPRGGDPADEDIVVVECRDCYGNSPLHYALGQIEDGLGNVVEDKGNKLPSQTELENMLRDAMKRKSDAKKPMSTKVIKKLLEIERNHNERASEAAATVKLSNVRTACAYTVTWKNNAGKTPLDLAKELNDDIYQRLLKFQPPPDGPAPLPPPHGSRNYSDHALISFLLRCVCICSCERSGCSQRVLTADRIGLAH